MTLLPDPAKTAAAGERFAAFFRELQEVFVERDALLGQLALALLAKEHVLLTGPPGTAKSQVSAAVLGRILDERTGQPSLYSRQFTENTVQTDLVGPINFKTLMETGRTEHFTDQGMLGAVHAFLDEVFDGRDMLLRSALNVLQERELKEGTRTVRGLIECALMTSNRYLAEILEGSRDTLLAFVDRVAFVSFMPRGFADPKNLATVLRRHVGGTGRVHLTKTLSVQDLDALQAMVDSVYVSDAACDAIAQLLEALELELSEAAKADPSFVPTRYISTRAAVRCGRVLRAIVVLDRLFRAQNRPLEVVTEDFAWLRLHLLLAGPTPEMVERLLARETDPRERRQLTIVRTEREAFDRCIAKLTPFATTPRTSRAEIEKLEVATTAAVGAGDPTRLAGMLRSLVPLAQAGGAEGERMAVLARQVGDSLNTRALRTAFRAGGSDDVTTTLAELEDLADGLGAGARAETPRVHELARFLRGRAVAVVDEHLTFDDAPAAEVALLSADDGAAIEAHVERRIARLEAIAATRARLVAAGAEVRDRAASDRILREAVLRLEKDCAALLDAGFRSAITAALARTPADRLGEVLSALAPDLARLDGYAARLGALLPGGERSRLKERVVGPRIEALVPAIFARIDAQDRKAVVGQVTFLHGVLQGAGLGHAVDAARFVQWSAAALARSDRGAPRVKKSPPGKQRYQALRAAEQRLPICATLHEIALLVSPALGDATRSPAEIEKEIRALLGGVSPDLARAVVEADLGRIQRALDELEAWWGALTDHDREVGAGDAAAALALVVESEFLQVLRDQGAARRFALEARLLRDSFPEAAEAADPLSARANSLATKVRDRVHDLAQKAGDAAFAASLAS